jgi:hypothetical protein
MSYALPTPCATTSTTQEVDVTFATWDLYSFSWEDDQSNTYSSFSTSYTTSSSSDSSSLPITYSSSTGSQPTDANGSLTASPSYSYSGCFVSVESGEFTTFETTDIVSSISFVPEILSSSWSSYTLQASGETEIAVTPDTRTINTWASFTSSESSSESFSGLVDGTYVTSCNYGIAYVTGSTYPAIGIFAVNSVYGENMNPQYDVAEIHPNVYAPISYPSYSSVTETSWTDTNVSTSSSYASGSLSQSDSTNFVLMTSTTVESSGSTITSYGTTISSYQVTYTFPASSSTFSGNWGAYSVLEGDDFTTFPQTNRAGAGTYDVTFGVGFYEWTMNGTDGSSSDSCSFISYFSNGTTTFSGTSLQQTISLISYTDSEAESDGGISDTDSYYAVVWVSVTTSYTGFNTTNTSYDTTSSSWSSSGMSFPEGITTSSSGSTSGIVDGSFFSNQSSGGVSSTQIVVPDGANLFFSALPYYWNTQTYAQIFWAPTSTTP